MTQPPQHPDDRSRPAGLGEPVTGVPLMHAPVARPANPGYPPPGHPPPPPTTPTALPEPPPPRPSRAPWAMAAALGCVAVIGLVVALFAIKTPAGDAPSADVNGGAVIECEPSDAEPAEAKLSADEFYDDATWENSYDDGDTAEQLGRWDHPDCCNVGLATSQETLNEADCIYGVESAYESADGHMGIGQLILAFPSSTDARQAEQIDFTSFKFEPDSGIYDDSAEVYGYLESSGSFLIITIGSIDSENQDIVDVSVETLGGFHYDHLDELPW